MLESIQYLSRHNSAVMRRSILTACAKSDISRRIRPVGGFEIPQILPGCECGMEALVEAEQRVR